jgi:ribosomal protein L29
MKMKKSEIKELLGLGEKAISGKIADATKELENFKLNLSRGNLKNVREARQTRRLIAVLKTHMTQGVK